MSCINYAGIYENNEEQNQLDAQLADEEKSNESDKQQGSSVDTDTNKSPVIKEYSWTNDDGFKVEDEHCFDMVKIKSEQTIEFNASSSTPAFIDKAD